MLFCTIIIIELHKNYKALIIKPSIINIILRQQIFICILCTQVCYIDVHYKQSYFLAI